MVQNRDDVTTNLPPKPEKHLPPPLIPQPLPSKRPFFEGEFGRILMGLLAGLAVGCVWVMLETLTGVRLMGLWMVVVAWSISALMRRTLRKAAWQFGLVSWRFRLPAVVVTLAACLLLDVLYCCMLYGKQAGAVPVSAKDDLLIFWAYAHFGSLLSYALAAAVAYYNSYDRSFARLRQMDESAAAGALVADVSAPPPRRWRIPTWVKLGLGTVVSFGSMGLFGWLVERTCMHEMAMSPDQRYLAVIEGGHEGRVVIRDGQGDCPVLVRSIPADHVTWSADGEWLACVKSHSGSNEKDAYTELWLVNRLGQSKFKVQVGKSSPGCLAFSPDGCALAAGGSNLLMIDCGNRVVRNQLTTESSIHCLVFTSNTTLAAGLSDGRIVLWDLVSGKPARSWQAHRTAIRGLAFQPDHRMLFSTGVRDGASAWDAVSGKELQRYPLACDWITGLALTPDGRTLAVCGGSFHRRGEVRVFDADSGELRQVFAPPSNTVTSVAFSGDGQTLFAGTRPPLNPLLPPYKGQVYRWNLTTGEELSPLH